MKFTQNINVIQKNEFNAGGTDNVPPAVFLPSAYAAAYVPACVERTGRAITNKSKEMRAVRHLIENSPVLYLELTC